MKWILFLLFFSVIVAAFGLWYLQDPGSITITWLGYEIQFSVIFGFIVLIILSFVGFIFIRLFYRLHSFIFYYLSFFQRSNNKERKENSDTILHSNNE